MMRHRQIDLNGCFASSLPYLQYFSISWNKVVNIIIIRDRRKYELVIGKKCVDFLEGKPVACDAIWIKILLHFPQTGGHQTGQVWIFIDLFYFGFFPFTYQLKKDIIEFEKKFRGLFLITIFKAVSSEFCCSVWFILFLNFNTI